MHVDKSKLIASTTESIINIIEDSDERKLLVQCIKKVSGTLSILVNVSHKKVSIIYTDFNKFDMSKVGRSVLSKERYGGACGELYRAASYVKWSKLDSKLSKIVIGNTGNKKEQEYCFNYILSEDTAFRDVINAFESSYKGCNDLVMETVLNIIMFGILKYELEDVMLNE